ncbi:two-component sensor histidine kinase, partial [Bacillus sp. SIMBA_069]
AKLEQEFYQKHNTWITIVDAMGNLEQTDDFFMEVRLERSEDFPELSGKTITIPLYTVMQVEDFSRGASFLDPWIKEGGGIAIEGL